MRLRKTQSSKKNKFGKRKKKAWTFSSGCKKKKTQSKKQCIVNHTLNL